MHKPICTIVLALAALPARAHHPLDGMPMETLTHGLLSGIGHPFLGLDHLFFVLLVGIAAAFSARRLLAPAAYIAAMLAGCLIAALATVLPATELMVALSLLVLGGLLTLGRRLNQAALLALFAIFGLFHGSAFGGFLAEQEAGFGLEVLAAYLLTLGLVQYGIALVPGLLLRNIWKFGSGALEPRLVSALITGAGLMLTLELLGAR